MGRPEFGCGEPCQAFGRSSLQPPHETSCRIRKTTSTPARIGLRRCPVTPSASLTRPRGTSSSDNHPWRCHQWLRKIRALIAISSSRRFYRSLIAGVDRSHARSNSALTSACRCEGTRPTGGSPPRYPSRVQASRLRACRAASIELRTHGNNSSLPLSLAATTFEGPSNKTHRRCCQAHLSRFQPRQHPLLFLRLASPHLASIIVVRAASQGFSPARGIILCRALHRERFCGSLSAAQAVPSSRRALKKRTASAAIITSWSSPSSHPPPIVVPPIASSLPTTLRCTPSSTLSTGSLVALESPPNRLPHRLGTLISPSASAPRARSLISCRPGLPSFITKHRLPRLGVGDSTTGTSR